VAENNQQLMNEIGMLNMRLNDMMNQLNRTVKMLLDENQRLATELQQLKEEGNAKAEKKKQQTT
jgi:regulator of replication initiation timing